MKLQDQVTSLELSKKIEELGIKRDSFFQWEVAFGKAKLIWKDYHKHSYLDTADLRKYYSAFTVADLGELLPFGVSSIHIDTRLSSEYADTKGGNWLCKNENRGKRKLIYADTEADARAKMLIYLLENKLITL